MFRKLQGSPPVADGKVAGLHGTERWRALQIALNSGGPGVGAIHFSFQGLELSQGDIAGAALRAGRVAAIKGAEGLAALTGQVCFQDIGGGVQVALGMATYQLLILGEGHITFQDAGAHTRSCAVGFFGMFREL